MPWLPIVRHLLCFFFLFSSVSSVSIPNIPLQGALNVHTGPLADRLGKDRFEELVVELQLGKRVQVLTCKDAAETSTMITHWTKAISQLKYRCNPHPFCSSFEI